MKKILVTIPVEERHKEYLQKQVAGGKEEVLFTYKNTKDVTAEDLDEQNALIGNVPASLLAKCPSLEWVQLNSAGADAYCKEGILAKECVLTNASGAYGLAVSEHMLALTFDLIRHFEKYHHNQEAHEWASEGKILSVEGSTILVMGLGDIGGSYAQKVKALGAYVIGIRKNHREKPAYLDEQYTLDELDQVIGRADIVAMVLPGGQETFHLMNEEMLHKMKKGSYLINVGRGNAIDPNALKRVLDEGHLGGAGLDVTEPEPLPAEDSLWDYENVVITPHVAGNFFLQETFERIVRIAGTNAKHYINGEAFEHVVNRNNGY